MHLWVVVRKPACIGHFVCAAGLAVWAGSQFMGSNPEVTIASSSHQFAMQYSSPYVRLQAHRQDGSRANGTAAGWEVSSSRTVPGRSSLDWCRLDCDVACGRAALFRNCLSVCSHNVVSFTVAAFMHHLSLGEAPFNTFTMHDPLQLIALDAARRLHAGIQVCWRVQRSIMSVIPRSLLSVHRRCDVALLHKACAKEQKRKVHDAEPHPRQRAEHGLSPDP